MDKNRFHLRRKEMRNQAIVMGATGLVGKALVHQLLADKAYEKVTVIVRRSIDITHEKLEEIIINFDKLAQLEINYTDADVFCTIGTTIKKAGSQEAFRKVDYEYPLQLAKMAKAGGAKQFLIITAMGANPSAKIFYSRVKGEIEEALKELQLPALHIFRPSLLRGKRQEFRLGEKIGEFFLTIFSPIFAGPLKKYGAIFDITVARAMIVVALKKQGGIHVYESDQLKELGS